MDPRRTTTQQHFVGHGSLHPTTGWGQQAPPPPPQGAPHFSVTSVGGNPPPHHYHQPDDAHHYHHQQQQHGAMHAQSHPRRAGGHKGGRPPASPPGRGQHRQQQQQAAQPASSSLPQVPERVRYATTGGEGDDPETDAHRIRQRKKQIAFGKVTLGYRNYRFNVPKFQRQIDNANHPVTPNVSQKCSKRKWDASVAAWRRALHSWDANPTPSSMANAGAKTLEELGILAAVPLNEYVASTEHELKEVAAFITSLRIHDPTDSNYGGESDPEREAIATQDPLPLMIAVQYPERPGSDKRINVSIPVSGTVGEITAELAKRFSIPLLYYFDEKRNRVYLKSQPVLTAALERRPLPRLFHDSRPLQHLQEEENDITRELDLTRELELRDDTPTAALLHDSGKVDMLTFDSRKIPLSTTPAPAYMNKLRFHSQSRNGGSPPFPLDSSLLIRLETATSPMAPGELSPVKAAGLSTTSGQGA